MKIRILLAMVISLMMSQGDVFAQAEQELLVMSYNIRLATSSDGINAWDNRKARLTDFLLVQKPDILGVQEALPEQMTYLRTQLPAYDFAGVGREDGIDKGEYSAIFYDKTRFRMLDKGNFWLSQTPEIPGSMGWDAACTRICTWAKLQNINTKTIFFVFNTHWDHIGVMARENSGSLVAQRIAKIAGKKPVILMGDFNCTQGSRAIQNLLNAPDGLVTARGLTQPEGPDFSFSGFAVGGEKGELIDHVFIKKDTEVLSYRILENSFEGNYLSDHLPVLVHLRISK